MQNDVMLLIFSLQMKRK